MPTLRQRLLAAWKGFSWNQGDWVNSDAPGNVYSSVRSHSIAFGGTRLNYEALVGPYSHNTAYMACMRAVLDTFHEAPPCIKIQDAEGQKVIDPNHPLTAIFDEPNIDDDGIALWDGTLLDLWAVGNAYWLPTTDRAGNVLELHYIPECCVRPVTPAQAGRAVRPGDRRILYYEYRPQDTGARYEIPPDEIAHLKWGVDPIAPWLGIGRGTILLREIFADNEATNYSASVLHQLGVMARLISPADPNTVFDPQELLTAIRQQITGDKRGADVVIDVPVNVHESTASPEKMALDIIRRYPESRVCAVTGVPAMVAGLLSGEGTRTYSNFAEARSAFWEDTMLPVMRRLSRQVTKQIVRPKFPDAVWFGFDYSEVRALQEDEDQRHTRARENWKAKLWDRARALTEIGDEPSPEDEGVFYGGGDGVEGMPEEDPEEAALARMNARKSLTRIDTSDDEAGDSWVWRVSAELAALDASPNGSE